MCIRDSYLPPNYTVNRGRKALEFIAGCVTRAKRQYVDPFIVVTGDFNQWGIEEALGDPLDMVEEDVGPTRSGRKIDRIFTNFHASSTGAGTVPPLETDDQTAKKSDHMVAYMKASLPRKEVVEWLDYSYRFYNADSAKLFGGWLAHKDWGELFRAEGSNEKASVYQREVVGAMEACFPLVKMRRKSTDPPWINNAIRKKLQQRRGVYWREGRSAKWKRLKKITESMINKRRARYVLSQKDALLAKDGERNFFKNCLLYTSPSPRD